MPDDTDPGAAPPKASPTRREHSVRTSLVELRQLEEKRVAEEAAAEQARAEAAQREREAEAQRDRESAAERARQEAAAAAERERAEAEAARQAQLLDVEARLREQEQLLLGEFDLERARLEQEFEAARRTARWRSAIPAVVIGAIALAVSFVYEARVRRAEATNARLQEDADRLERDLARIREQSGATTQWIIRIERELADAHERAARDEARIQELKRLSTDRGAGPSATRPQSGTAAPPRRSTPPIIKLDSTEDPIGGIPQDP